MRTLLIVSSIVAALFTAGQQETRGSIQVTVKDKLTGQGIPQAQVVLLAPANGGATVNTLTDNNGGTSIPNLALGRYNVRVQREGYVSAVTNSLGSIVTATVTLDTDHVMSTLIVELTQSTSISGRVRGVDGKPIAGITINPTRLVYQSGRPSLARVSVAAPPANGPADPTKPTTVTNNQGEYLLSGLPPGEYYLRAEYRPSVSTGGATVARISYFPGTADSAAAAPVVVHEREDLKGIDFEIPTIPNVKVSGKIVINVPGGCGGPVGEAYPVISTFFLSTRNPLALDREPSIIANAADPKTSTADVVPFELRNMPPGSWDLYPVCGKSGGGPNFTGRTPIEIKDRDIENLTLDVRPYIELNGKIVVSGKGVGNIAMERLGVVMRLTEAVPTLIGARGVGAAARGQNPQVSPDGVYSVPDLMQARYAPSITGLPRGLYLAGVRMGTQVSNDGLVRVDSPSPQLELTIAAGTTTVRGVVWDRTRQPFPRATVVLVPEQSKRENPLLYRRVTGSDDGEFTFPNIEPGEYKVFAWQTPPPNSAEESPQFLSKFEPAGRTVSVKGVAPAELQVDLIAD